uniref:Gag1-like clamp domain-containing protein n=1 Tax=Davidia involucrata TaxID=16924 RepID=A0A5B7AMY5_DAVIN
MLNQRDNGSAHSLLLEICHFCVNSTRRLLLESGCLCCNTKPKLITSIDEPLKGQRLQGRKPCISEDFWTTSTCEMDNSAGQSRGSISSISITTIDPHGASSGNIPSEFVNHGLLLWNQTRQQWVGNKRSESRAQQLREPKLSWNATYDSLLGSNKPFAQRIPLSEMVDFLVDIWEQEGMYD